jgi:glycosyltransferase involved in cell wall biosynthesis
MSHKPVPSVTISIIVPLYNEEGSLKVLHQQIREELTAKELEPYEILFINDGSKDSSLLILKELQQVDPSIRIINFYRNYGKAAALATGFQLCKGEYIVTMDADLQDDPKEISRFITMAEEKQLDLISGWKQKRYDSLEKRVPSKLFNYVVSIFGGIRLHDFNCGLKFYRKRVVKCLNHLIYGEMHRFIPLLAYWNGFAVGEMVVQHRPRTFGKSKYGLFRYFHGLIDLLSLTLLNRFRTRPMHIFGALGMLTLFPGIIINIIFLLEWIITQELHVRPIMIIGISLVTVAIQFFSLGFISDMILQRSAREITYNFNEL